MRYAATCSSMALKHGRSSLRASVTPILLARAVAATAQHSSAELRCAPTCRPRQSAPFLLHIGMQETTHLHRVPSDEDHSGPDPFFGLDQGVPALMRRRLGSLRIHNALLDFPVLLELVYVLWFDNHLRNQNSR